MSPIRAGLAGASLLLLAGCGEPDSAPSDPARPVTVITLDETAPPKDRGIVALVEPFRQEEIGFQVSGRIEQAVMLGRDVRGPTLDEQGEVVSGRSGQLVARLDATRYLQALESARLKKETAEKDLESMQVEAEQVLPAQIAQAEGNQSAAEQDVAAAQSTFDLASAEFERNKRLLASETISQSEYDNAKSELDSARAGLESSRFTAEGFAAAAASARANLRMKEVQIERQIAQIRELESARQQAQRDVDDCELRAPFSGRITTEHLGRGAFAAAGASVVTLTMMDPIKVSITVAGEQSRRLHPGARARIHFPELRMLTGLDHLTGMVTRKAEVADPATRTFRVDILARNVLRSAPQESDGQAVAVVNNLAPVYRSGDSLFVPARALSPEGDSVIRVAGYSFGSGDGDVQDLSHPVATERVPVEPEDELLTVLQFTFRRIRPGSALREFDMLVEEPKPEHEGTVRMEIRDWVMRPGDLVRASFEADRGHSGIYAPVEAIRTLNGTAAVFVVEDGRCRRVPIELHDTSGGRRRITGEGLTAGTQIALDGVHYLADGDRVTVARTAPWQTDASARNGDAR